MQQEIKPTEAIARFCRQKSQNLAIVNTLKRQKANGHQGIKAFSRATTYPRTLAINPQQRPHGSDERTVPSRTGAGQGLPQHRDLHHHDLFDRGPAWRYIQIHLKRRRALIIKKI